MVEPDGAEGACRSGAAEIDAAAFERMVEPETGFLYAMARGHLANAEMAKDAVQETILKAWQSRSSLRNQNYFRSWLGSILIHTCHSMRRRLKVEQKVTAQAAQAAPTHDPGEENRHLERQDALAEALRGLDEEDQMLLALKYSKGLKYAQIAAQMNLSVDAVRGRMFRAREELRQKLKGAGA